MLRWLDEHDRRVVATLVTLTLGVGIVYALGVGIPLRFADERKYLELARNIADEGTYAYGGRPTTAYQPPGWPAFLAVGLRLGVGVAGLHALNFALLAVSLLLLHRLGRAWGGGGVGAVAAGLAAGYPLLLFTATTLYPQTLATVLLVSGVLLVARRERTSLPRAALAGLVFGALLLTVPTLGILVGVVALWMLWPTRRALRPVAVMVTVGGLLVGGWTARNYQTFGQLVPVSTNGGFNLLLGNSPGTQPNSGTNVDISSYKAAAQGLAEVETDRFFRGAATRHMRDHPGRTARLYAGKLANHFVSRDELATASQGSRLSQLVLMAASGSLFALFLLRLALWRRLRPSPLETLIISLYLAGAGTYAVFFTRARFRVPLDLLLFLLIAILLHRLAVGRHRLGLSIERSDAGGLPHSSLASHKTISSSSRSSGRSSSRGEVPS